MSNFKNLSFLSSPMNFSSSSSKRDEEKHSINMSPKVPETQNPMLKVRAYSSSNVENVAIINPRGLLGYRPRGRPLGSKNRPKGTVTKDSDNKTLKVIALKVPCGVNILDWVADFAQSRKVSVVILNGFGSISQATLCHLGTQLPGTIYYEKLKLVSLLGGYILYPSVGSSTTTFFNASLARINGGVVVGSALQMVTSGIVVLTAMIFSDMKAFKIEALA